MIVSHDKKLIFVHNQKTGGISTEGWLVERCPDVFVAEHRHLLVRESVERHGRGIWDDYFSFGFVRNPWERQVSWWNMFRENRNANPERPFWQYIQANGKTFEDFILNCTAEVEDYGVLKSTTRPQLDYFTDAEGRVLVKFIGRFERLQEDMDVVTQRTGLPAGSVPHHNVARVKQHYQDYYTPKLRKIVADRFAKDIVMFGYTFQDSTAAR
jgi:hypothetical protein